MTITSPRPSHRARSSRIATAAAIAVLAAIPAVLGTTPAAAAVTHQAYGYTGHGQNFIVPAGVTTLFVSAIGASGGQGEGSTGHPGGAGGAAGSVSASLTVTPGQVLGVWIGAGGAAGAAGGTAHSSSGLKLLGAPVFAGPGGAGGPSLGRGGGGGAATVITAGSTAQPADPLVFAGGGGGGGGANVVGAGGDGGAGGNPAVSGTSGTGSDPAPGGHGGPVAGTGISGGSGQNAVDIDGAGGGGGSGFNISDGHVAGGGAGGRSIPSSGASTAGGAGGGGGLSSAVTSAGNVHFATAAQRGDGTVFISWDQPATATTLGRFGEVFPGQAAVLSASVAPATPAVGDPPATGNLTFYDGAAPLGNAPLATAQGVAAATLTKTLTPGTHQISAAYNGDGVYAGSSSTSRTVQVDALPVFSSPAVARASVGTAFTLDVHATGVPSVDIVASGPLDGLSLHSHTDGSAILSGLPISAGTFAITLTASNGFTPTVQHLVLTVTLNPLSIGTASLPPAFVGQAYSTAPARSGGTPPFTWSVTAGALPRGLSLNPMSGTISGTPITAGTSTATIAVTDTTSPVKMVARRTYSLVTTGITPAVYAANGANNTVTSYPLGTGNLSPATRLAGIADGLNGPAGLVLNAAGRLYVADSGGNAVTAYDRGATTPTLTITGADTGLASPGGLTLDGNGRLYVTDRAANTITVYAPGADGDATPVATIAGPHTGLDGPAALVVDPSGRLWVANASANSLTAYPTAATGDATPVATIAGSATGLNDPQGITLAPSGSILAANTFGESITAYDGTGNVAPVRTISGSATGLSFPTGLDVDASGTIYVANQFDNDITSYADLSSGNVPPRATIAGSGTGLAGPAAIAVTKPLPAT